MKKTNDIIKILIKMFLQTGFECHINVYYNTRVLIENFFFNISLFIWNRYIIYNHISVSVANYIHEIIINIKANYVQTLCRRRMIFSLYSLFPSIIPVTGLLNHSLNSLCDWNTFGIKKCINDHNSIKLFWRGVPVSNKRL